MGFVREDSWLAVVLDFEPSLVVRCGACKLSSCVVHCFLRTSVSSVRLQNVQPYRNWLHGYTRFFLRKPFEVNFEFIFGVFISFPSFVRLSFWLSHSFMEDIQVVFCWGGWSESSSNSNWVGSLVCVCVFFFFFVKYVCLTHVLFHLFIWQERWW